MRGVEMDESVITAAEEADRAAIVAKAFLRAGDKLALSSRILAAIIGLSEPSISRMRSGHAKLLAPGSKPRELAALFLRLYRALDTIVGGDDSVSSQWLRNDNAVLGGAPIALIQTVQGLVRVTDYLDSRRAVV